MMFGEIVEPSTRALILDDELEELPEYVEPISEWEGNPQPPSDIEHLIIADSPKVIQICLKITRGMQPVAKLINEGLRIYKIHTNYLVVFDGNCKNLVSGEIVTLLSPWLSKSKAVHCITSTLLSSFQPWESLGGSSPVTFTRCLTNNESVPYNFCKRLESPNLIQGFGANVFTYCIHSKYKASLWVIFTDNMPLDSVNSNEIVRLFKTLGLDVKVEFKVDSLTSNLYM